MEVAPSESVGSVAPSDNPPSSVVPVLRRFLTEGYGLQARIQQLSSKLPPAFTETKSEFSPVLADFKYLKDAENENEKLRRSKFLENLYSKSRTELREVCRLAFDILYQVVQFHGRVYALVDDIIKEKRYTQDSLEAVTQDHECLCLLIELMYSVGAILLLVDRCLPGLTRERLIVAYARHNNCLDLILQNQSLQKLCKKTGYIPGTRLPQGYPESYLMNFPLQENVVRCLLGVLLQTDVYSVLKHYPNPAHRTTALSHQAAYAFVFLFFVPDILSKDMQFMKQVVERLFVDRWVLPWLRGYTANLRFEWEGYRAAKSALKAIHSRGKRSKIGQQHYERIVALSTELERHFKTETLQTESFLRHNSDTFSLVREANVTLQWILLHAFSDRWMPDASDGESIVQLLLDLATLEQQMFSIYQQLIDSRQDRIEEAGELVKNNLQVLIDQNSPSSSQATKSNHDAHLLYWLRCLCAEVDAIGSVPSAEAGEKVRSIQSTFDELVNFGQLESTTPHGRKVLDDIRSNLVIIQHLMNIRQEVMDTLKLASDFSYAFHLSQNEHFVKLIQTIVRRDPANLEKVGSLLTKMRSVLQSVCNKKPDHADKEEESGKSGLNSYYESQLRVFAERVFDHVPDCVCDALDQMTVIRTYMQKMRRKASTETPTLRFGLVVKSLEEKNKSLDDTSSNYAKLAHLSVEIALFSTGLLKVEARLGNTMPLDLRKNLESRLRQHIARRLLALANQKLQFGLASPSFTFQNVSLKSNRQVSAGQAFSGVVNGKDNFENKITELKEYFDGLLHSLECTQDSLDFPGCGLWQGELAHIIAINLKKEYKWMTKGKSGRVTGKRQTVADSDSSLTFLGRLVREIVRLTSPGTTHYSVQGSWLDASGTEVFGVTSMELLRQSIGVQGLAALDTLLATRVVKLLKKLHELCMELCTLQTSGQKTMLTYARELQSCEGLTIPMEGAMWYVDAIYSVGSRTWAPILDLIAAIGQSQLLRKLIALECRNISLLEAPVSFHRTMQLLSDFVEDKDADFSSCYRSADRLSGHTGSTAARDSASLVSGLSIATGDNKSDEDMTLDTTKQGTFQHETAPTDEGTTSEMVQSQNEPDVEEDRIATPEADSSQLSDVDVPASVFVRHSEVLESELRTELGTITETSSRNERDLNTEMHYLPPTVDPTGSPDPSMGSLQSGSITGADPGTRAMQHPYEAGHVSLAGGVSRASRRKLTYNLHHSEASSSNFSSAPLWDSGALKRKPKQTTSEASGFQVRSEASSGRRMFLPSVDLSMLGGDSACDLFNSPSTDASAPVLRGTDEEGVIRLLQSTGFLNPTETRYTSENIPPSEVPIVLFLATVSIVHKYEFNKQSASLMRPLGSTIPDAKSFAYGLVTILYQYVPSITDQFLRHVGQYVRAYLKTATGATAQGIAAAGVKMILPREVERTVAFVCEMCEVGNWSRKRAEKFIPPFLLNVWVLGV